MKFLNFKKEKIENEESSKVTATDSVFKAQTPPPTNIQVNTVVKNNVGWPLKITIFILLLGIVGVTGIIVYIKVKRTPVQIIETVKQVETTEKSKIQVEAEQLNSIAKAPKEVSTLTTEITLGIENIPVKYNLEGYKTINARILELQNDGTIKKVDNAKLNDLLSLAQKNNVQIIPVLYINYDLKAEDRARLEKLNYDKLLSDIYGLITTNNYQGINLDHTLMTDRKVFEDLTKDLSTKLKKDNKILKITITAKWGSEQDYTPYINYSPYYYFTISLKDYEQYFDEVVITAYDYTNPFSILAGPISGIDWIEKVIQYTVSQNISRDKIVIGINTNGYDWIEREFVTTHTTNYSAVDKQAKVLNSEEVLALIAVVSSVPTVKTNEDSIVNYNLENKTHTLVYPSIGFQLNVKNLVAVYGLKGIAYNGF